LLSRQVKTFRLYQSRIATKGLYGNNIINFLSNEM